MGSESGTDDSDSSALSFIFLARGGCLEEVSLSEGGPLAADIGP
jgi:hypothetical protein